MNEEVLYSNGLVCLLVLAVNLAFLLFDEILAKEKHVQEERSGNKQVWSTTKEDNSVHGFGIKNIDRIVQMYGGYCERELKNHIFRCRIRVPGK